MMGKKIFTILRSDCLFILYDQEIEMQRVFVFCDKYPFGATTCIRKYPRYGSNMDFDSYE